MTNIYKLVYDTLVSLGYPVKEQGTLSGTLPETFITYQLIDTQNNSHADNVPTSITHRIQVTLYSKSPTIKQNAETAIKAVMIPAKFMRGNGRDLPYNKETMHYAYTVDYKYYNMED